MYICKILHLWLPRTSVAANARQGLKFQETTSQGFWLPWVLLAMLYSLVCRWGWFYSSERVSAMFSVLRDCWPWVLVSGECWHWFLVVRECWSWFLVLRKYLTRSTVIRECWPMSPVLGECFVYRLYIISKPNTLISTNQWRLKVLWEKVKL